MSLKLCSVGAELRFVGGGLATALVTFGVPHNRVQDRNIRDCISGRKWRGACCLI
jgi:hypothetical protein